MAKQTEKLTFFCQLCDKSIESNICRVHGIDFVTIKKIATIEKKAKENEKKEEKRLNGMLQLDKDGAPGNAKAEKRIATQEQIKEQDAFLPVIPTDSEEEQSLKPVPTLKIPREDVSASYHDNPLRESVQSDLEDQLNDYQVVDEEVSDYYEEYTAPAQQTVPSRQKSYKGIVAASLAIMIIISAVVAYFAVNQPPQSPTSIYSQAESYYDSQNYPAALSLYTQFAESYPNDPLIPMVNEKIAMINQQTSPVETAEDDEPARIKELMLKANIALQRQQYVKPKDENVIAYTTAVLKIVPNYQPAVEMYNNVINHYETLAEQALEKGKYNDAIIYYQTILEIKPNDAELIGKIHSILTQKDETSTQ
jgi:tetratricopeptide (TPR) repeat protein